MRPLRLPLPHCGLLPPSLPPSFPPFAFPSLPPSFPPSVVHVPSGPGLGLNALLDLLPRPRYGGDHRRRVENEPDLPGCEDGWGGRVGGQAGGREEKEGRLRFYLLIFL